MNILRQMSTISLCFCLIALAPVHASGQQEKAYAWVPFTKIFYHLDDHLLGSFTDNYGLNHAIAISASYGLGKSGADWKWNTFANDRGISNPAFASVSVGGFVPIAVPLGLYLYGGSVESSRLQLAALAMGQAAMISVGIASAYKAVTGRRPPAHRNEVRGTVDYCDDFKFGLLNRGAYNGWPSSHTMTAFAMAGALNEIYPENRTLHIASYAYASFIGLGVSTNIHWLSDAVAGALIGYSIGKTVGAGFGGLRSAEEQSLNFQITLGRVGIVYRF